MSRLTVSYPVPYVCQSASPELVRAFIYKERPLESDPRWAEYGATSAEEYAHWALRSCGIVCLKMAVDGITGRPSGTVMDWVRAGLALNGYLSQRRADRPVEVGWKHSTLAQLAIERGCQAETVAGLSPDQIAAHVQADRLLIASVTSELGEDGPLTRASGHLVVVYGVVLSDGGEVEGVILHNPSGRTAELQAGATAPATRFAEGFSGRGIVIGLPPIIPR